MEVAAIIKLGNKLARVEKSALGMGDWNDLLEGSSIYGIINDEDLRRDTRLLFSEIKSSIVDHIFRK